MKRLRLVFLVLSALLWLPLLGLVVYALRSVEQEEAGRYKAVAERVFDEMERELTEVLAREEQRPQADYIGSASPVRDANFVVGYFERDGSQTLRHSGWRRDAETVQRLLEANPVLMAAAGGGVRGQAPGTTQELARQGRDSKTYDAFSSLNRGAWSRTQSNQRDPWSSLDSSSPAARLAAPSPVAPPSQPTVSSPLRVVAGTDSERFLVLAREVSSVEGEPSTQGLVVDLPELLRSLEASVLAPSGLGRAAALHWLPPGAREAGSETTLHRYQHRFGEPFSSLSAVLTLRPLAELETSRYLYASLALLLGLGALGLFASYRMVATIVGFAERRSNFVSAVTHELKTPLTSIRMYGEMLRDDVVSEPHKRHRYYRIITAESERLTRLIDNVLELAKLERGQRPVSLSLGDITGVVRETLEVLEPHASELGFALQLELAPDLPAVRFDRDALSQVLFNLLDNALKYGSESADRTITIRCERQGAGVCVRVIDRGPGVAPEQLRKIWEPFFRGERELTRKHKGTGIGLALVRGLVQRMGGAVTGRNLSPGFEVSVTLG